MAESVLCFTEVCMVGVTEFFNHAFHLDHLFVFRRFANEGIWSQNVSRNCFCDGYWGRTGQLLANVYSLLAYV